MRTKISSGSSTELSTKKPRSDKVTLKRKKIKQIYVIMSFKYVFLVHSGELLVKLGRLQIIRDAYG